MQSFHKWLVACAQILNDLLLRSHYLLISWFRSTNGLMRFLFLLNSVVNATFCDDQSASSMKGCFARIWELVFTRNNSKFFSKIFRQISNFAKIIFLLLVVPLNACILLNYFHAFLLSTEFRYWFYWLIRNSQPVLDLKSVATARDWHCHCCSKFQHTAPNFPLSCTSRLNPSSSSYFLKFCFPY